MIFPQDFQWYRILLLQVNAERKKQMQSLFQTGLMLLKRFVKKFSKKKSEKKKKMEKKKVSKKRNFLWGGVNCTRI